MEREWSAGMGAGQSKKSVHEIARDQGGFSSSKRVVGALAAQLPGCPGVVELVVENCRKQEQGTHQGVPVATACVSSQNRPSFPWAMGQGPWITRWSMCLQPGEAKVE